MEKKYKALLLEQMDKKLDLYKSISLYDKPLKGWINAIRKAIGMTGSQLGKRVGVSAQRLYDIEKGEQDSTLTLKAIQQVANAMNCDFVYAIVPKTSLKRMVEEQARKVTEKDIASTSSTMTLEAQGLSKKELEKILEETADELVKTRPSRLWNEI